MIKLSDITKLIIEADTYKARSKETGRVVVFKSQDSYDAAVKGGSHEPLDKPSKTKDKSKGKSVDDFGRDGDDREEDPNYLFKQDDDDDDEDDERDKIEQAIRSAEDVSKKYGIDSEIAGNEQGLNRVNIGAGGEYEGDNQITVNYDDGKYGVGVQGEDAMQGPISYMSFDSKEELESALDRVLGNEKIKNALKKGESLEGMKDEIESLMKGGDDGADDVEPVKYKFGKGIPTSSDVKVDQETKDTILQDLNPPRDAERDENGLPTNEEDWDKEMTEVESMYEKARDAYEAAEKDASDAAFDDDEEEADYLSDRATQALVQYEKYKKVRDAYEAKGEELGVFESVKINGKMYKPIRESKKKLNPRIFKKNYDKIFRSLK
jgi:hypothetical protein